MKGRTIKPDLGEVELTRYNTILPGDHPQIILSWRGKRALEQAKVATITNLRPGCIGVDLQPPLKPMRRRDEDWFAPMIDQRLARKARNADRLFCILFFACVMIALVVYSVRLIVSLKANGMM